MAIPPAFAEAFASYRRMLAAARDDGNKLRIIEECAYQSAKSWIDHGLERPDAVDEIHDMAVCHGLSDTLGSDRLTAVIGAALQRGDNDREVVPPLDEDLQHTNGHDKTAKPHIPLPFVDMASWDATPQPVRPWAVLNRIPLRQPTLFSGEGAVGKTLLELQLCVAHVLGRDWLGSMPEQGPAIYFGCEDEPDELRRRLTSIAEHYGAKFADLIAGGLHILSFAGEDALLGVPDRSGKIAPTPLFERLLQAASDIKPKHVGIDTSADVFGGNEIDRAQVRQFASLLRKLAMACDGSVVLLSHPSLTGISSGTGLSGSTAWFNSVRAHMYLKSPKSEQEEQPDTDLRELTFRKNQYGRVAESIVLRFKNGLFLPEPSMSALDRAAHEQKVDDTFLAVAGKLIATDRPLSPSPNARNYAPKVIANHPDGQVHKRQDYQAAMERLIEIGKIHVGKTGRPAQPIRVLVLGAGL